jgi:predicted PhzF superfamily epimerase YddE/YHI9
LATAHVLWEEGHLERTATARFQTRSGLLTAERRSGGWIELDFPAEPAEPAVPPEGLAEALGVDPRFTGRNRFDWLVEVDSEETVRRLVPDLTALAAIPARGIILTSQAGERLRAAGFDFVSRFFAPRLGVPEDPVCGSAHCCLAPYWGRLLARTSMVGYQASPRGGVVRVRTAGSRVVLGGQAVTVLKGELMA